MWVRLWLISLVSLSPLFSQSSCEGTPAYSPCEFSFELAPAESKAHPDPYQSIELRIEFRSPRFHTFLMPAFWDGRKMIVRFTPTEPGEWIYKVTSNLAALEGKQGTFHATESDAAGYVHPANVHHWATDDKKPHLWMGTVIDRFATMAASEADTRVSNAAASKFNHIRISLLSSGAYSAHKPNAAYFDELDRRILAIHKRRITTDIVLAGDPDALVQLFPDWQARKRFVRYVIARYGSLNVTWQGVEEFEGHPDARALLKEIGLALKELDPYQHPRSTNAKLTSSPFLQDGWMNFVIDHSSNDQIGAVEHQFYPVPFVGVTTAQHLWNATMNGQYPVIEGEIGTQPKVWFDFMAETRHWELEPDFDVDAARCVALEGTEYVVLVEKSGPIEVEVEKHGYDVAWLNPLNGETIDQKKYKGEHYTGSAPNSTHPWILLIAREGRKESMLKSYKFESRLVPLQDIEQNAAKVPFEIVEPAGDTLAGAGPFKFAAKLKRETRATRSIMYLWTGEVPADGQGFRVLGTGAQGAFKPPTDIATRYPAVLSIRVSAINANGKAYSADKVYQLTK